MEAVIEEIAREVSIPISVGTIIRDLAKNDDYEVKVVSRADIILEHKPFLRGEKKDDLTVGYDELVHAFSKGRFFITGFSTTIENGYKHDLEKLKRAVKDTVDKIKLADEKAELAKVSAQKSELEREKEIANKAIEDALKEKALLERDKLKVMDEKESLVQKRRSKLRSKLTRQEEERAREEQKRLDEEERRRKIRILNLKKSSQQQRFRLLKKQIN